MCASQLVMDCCDEGLERYVINGEDWGDGNGDEDKWERTCDPYNMPYLCESMDGGSDGISAYHCLTKKEHMDM